MGGVWFCGLGLVGHKFGQNHLMNKLKVSSQTLYKVDG